MEILPKTMGARPRLAVEIRWGGVIAARAEDASIGTLSQVSRIDVDENALEPGLKAGNFRDRSAVVSAVRKTLEAVTEKGLGREVTLVVPDSTVRVLFLDFDAIPTKAAEALPLIRFRLKKLLPFDADGAVISYQVMSGTGTRSAAREAVRVLAVAIPQEVLAEYEGVVREAGFEPGAVLPSTLAALAGLEENTAAALVVNAGPQSVTTAIVGDGVLMLHRSVDMSGNVQVGILAEANSSGTLPLSTMASILPLVSADETRQEWAMQEPVDPYAREELDYDPMAAALVAAIEAEVAAEALRAAEIAAEASIPTSAQGAMNAYVREVTQAVSVAAAYFEDTMATPPESVLSAGSTSAEALQAMLTEASFAEIADGFGRTRVREMVDTDMLVAQAVSSPIPRGWMAGVRGALRS